MGWMYVLIAAASEMFGALGLSLFSKHRNLINGLMYYGGLGLSLFFLYQSFHYLQTSVAYAVWVGIGTAGVVIMNMLFFGEAKNLARILSLLAIVAGVVGLKAMS